MMYFYQPIVNGSKVILDGDEHQHCIKVLRKRKGDQVGILDGKGGIFTGTISLINKRDCEITIEDSDLIRQKSFSIHIAIAPTKSMDRIEWFVEKACELGVDQISFILTDNCERRVIKTDRLVKKAVSALKQSKTGYLTKINDIVPFQTFVEREREVKSKCIAYVDQDLPHLQSVIETNQDGVVLIGPEGDFTLNEVQIARDKGYAQVSLGKSTLRTETAGIIASHTFNIVNRY